MKKVVLFHFESCPFCRVARRWIGEAQTENPALQAVEIELIDERQHPAIARQYDYWLVPTFYVDGNKVHEGVCTKHTVLEILQMGCE
ncbi:MAG: glutathione S-transferase N-terminal domain-containing protein [Bacillota bacterium]